MGRLVQPTKVGIYGQASTRSGITGRLAFEVSQIGRELKKLLRVHMIMPEFQGWTFSGVIASM
jgi:hypothetical protein